MNELPEGWTAVPVKQLLGRTTNVDPGKSPATSFELWSVPSFSERRPETLIGSEIRSAKQVVHEGDVLLCKIVPHINRVWLVEMERGLPQIASGEWIVLRQHGCDANYLRYCLSAPAFREQFLQTVSGVGGSLMRARPSAVAEIEVPLAPLAEQGRIVAKLDALTARTARVRADLDRIPMLAERYRRGVLQAAFQGKLTTLPNDEQVDAASVSRVPQDDMERGRWEFEGLQKGWEWLPFLEVFEDVTHSSRKLPTKEYQETGGYPVVDQGEVRIPGYTDREDLVHPSEPPFIIFGDHTRCVKYIEEPFVQGADGVKVLKARPTILPKYAARLLQALELPNKGYSRHNKFLRASYFPVCDRDTQAEVIRRIDTAFAEIDRLTAEAAAARRLLDRLDQAVLAKAFRGELVPQDPADEPASALLERIRAERAGAPKVKRGRPARTAA